MLDRAPDETTRWLEFCGPGQITGQAALVDYNLGQYRAAADRDPAAIGLLPAGFGRNSVVQRLLPVWRVGTHIIEPAGTALPSYSQSMPRTSALVTATA